MLFCRRHWLALPEKIQDAIWREYRPGQECDKQPSLRYLAVQRVACAHAVFKPHDEAAAAASVQCLIEATRYQRAAIKEGLGDPLDGLVPVSPEGAP